MGFPELKKKTIGSIHYIPGIYPYGVSSRPLFIFVFLTSSWSSEAKYLAENGVSGTFWKKLLVPFKVFLKNSHMCSTRLQNRNLYWIFLDEVGSDQSRGILSPIYGRGLLCQEPWLDAALCTHGVARLHAARGATGNPTTPVTKTWSIPTT